LYFYYIQISQKINTYLKKAEVVPNLEVIILSNNVPMPKIPELLKSLRDNNWHLTVFEIYYNGCSYIVIFEDAKEIPHPNYYSVKLTFIKNNGSHEELETFAKANKINISLTEFVRFFNIQKRGQYADFIKDFYKLFNNQMPSKFTPIDSRFVDYALQAINRHEPNNGRCCYDARRNLMPNSLTEYKCRTVFNTEKTKLLRPDLFAKLGRDPHISFYYREYDELDDNEILKKLNEHDINRR